MRLMKIQDEERRRIARELHDSAGQTLTVLGLSLAQLVQKAEVTAPELAKEGKEIEEVVQQLHREIRTTSYLLHPPLLDECGLASALNWYVEGLAKRSGIAIKSGHCRQCWKTAQRNGACDLPTGTGVFDQHPPSFGKQDCLDSNICSRQKASTLRYRMKGKAYRPNA